ncbi:hypothetical protein YC2023_024232 [Brassica napus]
MQINVSIGGYLPDRVINLILQYLSNSPWGEFFCFIVEFLVNLYIPFLTTVITATVRNIKMCLDCELGMWYHSILSLQSLGIPKNSMYTLLQPHLDVLLFEIIFPLMCFNDDDQVLWDEDPHEYVRKGYGMSLKYSSSCFDNPKK